MCFFYYYGPAVCLMKGGRDYCYHCDYFYSHDGDDDDDDDYLFVQNTILLCS